MNTPSKIASAAQPRAAKFLPRGLRILAAVVFLAAGVAKLVGVPEMVQAFEQIGVGQWFRIVTGIVELVGGIAILIPATAALGGLLLSATMIGALLAHLFVIEGSPVPAIVLLLITATITWQHRPSRPAAARLGRA